MSRGFKKQYPDALRRRVILDYIKEHSRSPSREQIFELIQQKSAEYPNLNTLGFSSYDVRTPSFGEVSSAEKQNKNRFAIRDDLVVINKKADELVQLLEDSYRSFISTADRAMKLGKSIDARLDNLRLLSSNLDMFVYGMEETFDTVEFVDLEKSTTQVNPGYVTLGRRRFIKQDLSAARFEITSTSPKGKVFGSSNTSTRALLEEDGKKWEYMVTAGSSLGRVTTIISIDLNTDEKGQYVGDIRLTGDPIDSNSKQYATVYYSLNGTSYTALEPGERKFVKGENTFCLGKEGVQKIKIALSKFAADTVRGSSHTYLFSLDSLEILTGEYTVDKTSTMYAGPYYISDDLGNPINYSLATLSHGTCCIIPDRTSISFFLSKDNENWIPASFTDEALSVVQFSISNPVGTEAFLNGELKKDSLTTDTDLLSAYDVSIEYGKEAICNLFIPEEFSKKFVLQNTRLKRNFPGGKKNLYGISSGWFIDKENLQYKTSIHVDAIEGVSLNLGSTSAYLNGRLVTGTITLPQGYHDFSTSFSNWYDVEGGIKTAAELEAKDPNYPFNHKLLIEGYPYPMDFSGDKVYGGMAEYFGSLLKYVTPERFTGAEFDGDLSIYTIEEYNGNLFFKVKIDPADSSWVDEWIKIEYMLRTDDVNTLYVKAILRTSDTSITPNINRFQVRVV
jgi:hypothetical protein